MKGLSIHQGTYRSEIVHLNFIGGYTETELDHIPNDKHGIYAAYACVADNKYHMINKLLYIGKAEGSINLQKRIKGHVRDDHAQWEEDFMTKDEFIVYCYAIFEENYLKDVESALIHHNLPFANEKGKDKYNGDIGLLTIFCDGENGSLISPSIGMKIIAGSK